VGPLHPAGDSHWSHPRLGIVIDDCLRNQNICAWPAGSTLSHDVCLPVCLARSSFDTPLHHFRKPSAGKVREVHQRKVIGDTVLVMIFNKGTHAIVEKIVKDEIDILVDFCGHADNVRLDKFVPTRSSPSHMDCVPKHHWLGMYALSHG